VASTNDSLIITVIGEPTAQYFNTHFTILSCYGGCKNPSCDVWSQHHPSKHNIIEKCLSSASICLQWSSILGFQTFCWKSS